MTLRARLLSLTLSMVTMVAVTLIALNLNSLALASLDVAISSSEMAARQILSVVRRKVMSTTPTPGMTLRETKELWMRSVATDADLAALLEGTMAQSTSIVEINVAGEDSIVLAASNPRRRGKPMMARQDLHALRDATALGRLTSIWKGRNDFETRLPLGVNSQTSPLFTIQILVAPVLLRAAMLKPLRDMAAASGLALLLAFVLAYWSARVALRPVERIGHLIDDIAVGKVPDLSAREDEAREFAIIESKLNLLGERFRGATRDLEGALARVDAGTRRQIEDQLAVARRLTAINSLTGRVAHEIKNPLNSIALRLEVLRSRLSEESPDADAEFAILSEEVLRLDRVVRTFLDFNKPVQVRLADTDIGALIREMLDFLEPEAQTRGIAVVFEEPGRTVTARADSDLLRQALLNISINAMEAMGNGGKLRVQLDENEQSCMIAISDTGPGIPREQLDKIFQLYFSTKPRGSGIGLAMAFRAVQLHGGTIEAISIPGRGATFQVTLPWVDGSAQRGLQLSPGREGLTPRTGVS